LKVVGVFVHFRAFSARSCFFFTIMSSDVRSRLNWLYRINLLKNYPNFSPIINDLVQDCSFGSVFESQSLLGLCLLSLLANW
jgi:hypothetical protein